MDYGALIEANDANGVLLAASKDKNNMESLKNGAFKLMKYFYQNLENNQICRAG